MMPARRVARRTSRRTSRRMADQQAPQQAAPPPPAPAAAPPDDMAQIQQLATMKDQGLLDGRGVPGQEEADPGDLSRFEKVFDSGFRGDDTFVQGPLMSSADRR